MSDVTGAREIADDLARRLAEGEWLPGERFPSRVALRREYNTNVRAIDTAVDRLVTSGLVIPGRGRQGSVVAPPKPAVSLRHQRFSESHGGLRGHFADWPGRNPTVDVRQIEVVDLTGDLAVHVGEEAALLRHRRYLVDDQVTQVATSWVPMSVAEPIGRLWVADTGHGGMYERFREAGWGPLTILEEISSRPVLAAEAVEFGAPAQAIGHVFEVWRTVGSHDGRVLEVAKIVMRADRYRLVYEGPLP